LASENYAGFTYGRFISGNKAGDRPAVFLFLAIVYSIFILGFLKILFQLGFHIAGWLVKASSPECDSFHLVEEFSNETKFSANLFLLVWQPRIFLNKTAPS
jgi:hypothetical protein